MSTVEPRIPSGFMELLPADQIVFNWMLRTIREVYERHGFEPIETPALEYSDVLLAKGGGETEKQVYEFTRGDRNYCLHFDLTVPLARYVAEHARELVFPFRRSQLQKVWRAERAQHGRYREFYQCDIDVIGSNEPMVDAEIPSVIFQVFQELGIGSITIRMNNRKVLNGMLTSLGIQDRATEILRIIDKVDKIGWDAVEEEIGKLSIAPSVVKSLRKFLEIEGKNEEVLQALEALGVDNELFQHGLVETREILQAMALLGVPADKVVLDLRIARGLDYYTGVVYETHLDGYEKIGSICSGGRYDDLASYYTTEKLPGVGVSIGLTRLFSQLKEAGLLPKLPRSVSKALIIPFSKEQRTQALQCAQALRAAKISCEVSLESWNLRKHFRYASGRGVPFVIVIGENEVQKGVYTLKDMEKSEQRECTLDELKQALS